MALTPNGYPYPVGTDLVSSGDDTLQALAQAADTKAGEHASGKVTTPVPSALNNPMTMAVVLPVGRFTTAPYPQVTPQTTTPQQLAAAASLSSTSGILVYATKVSGALTAETIFWHADNNP